MAFVPGAPGVHAHTDVHTPCDEPIPWRIGDVEAREDIHGPRFELEARWAAQLWNDAAGRTVLEYAPDNGFPVHLENGARQREADAIRQKKERIEALKDEAGREQAALARARETLEEKREQYQAQRSTHSREIEQHNERVAGYDGAGRDEQARALDDAGRSLRQRAAELDARRAAIERKQASWRARAEEHKGLTERLNEHIRRYRERTAAASHASGSYRVEVERNAAGESQRTARSITVHFFHVQKDLRFTLAHEFGHALGIDHVDDPDAVMHAQYTPHDPNDVTLVSLQPADVAALHALCPRQRALPPQP